MFLFIYHLVFQLVSAGFVGQEPILLFLYFIIWLALWAGKMKGILSCDSLQPSPPPRLPALFGENIVFFFFI